MIQAFRVHASCLMPYRSRFFSTLWTFRRVAFGETLLIAPAVGSGDALMTKDFRST